MAAWKTLTLATIFAVMLFAQGGSATVFNVRHYCGGNLNIDISSVTSFSLGNGETKAITMPSGQWIGRVKATNCGSSANSLAEFNLHNSGDGLDWYNLSNVDAYDYPICIFPSKSSCKSLCCSLEPSTCPGYSGCTCVNPNRDSGDTDYAKFIRSKCSQTYSWSKDDSNHVFTCQNTDYTIQFC